MKIPDRMEYRIFTWLNKTTIYMRMIKLHW